MEFTIDDLFPPEHDNSGWQNVFANFDEVDKLCNRAKILYGIAHAEGNQEEIELFDLPIWVDLKDHEFSFQFSLLHHNNLVFPDTEDPSQLVYWNDALDIKPEYYSGDRPNRFPLALEIQADPTDETPQVVLFQLRLNGSIIDCLYSYDETGIGQTGAYDKETNTFRPIILLNPTNPAEIASLQIRLTPPFASQIPVGLLQSSHRR